MNRVVLMLELTPGQSPVSLGNALKEGAEQIVRNLPAVARVRVGLRPAQNPVERIPHVRYVSPRTFDGLVEISAFEEGSEQIHEALRAIDSNCRKFVHHAESAIVAGTAHSITGGAGSFLLAYAIRRPQLMSPDDWSRHWLTTHAQIGRNVPGLRGYVQLHSRREDNAWAAQAAGGFGVVDFDGVALTEYAGPDEFVEILSQREVVQDAIGDEFEFIDPARSTMTFVKIVADTAVDALGSPG